LDASPGRSKPGLVGLPGAPPCERSRMAKRKDCGPPGESREDRTERTYATAMAIIETDTQSRRAKTERLRALRLAEEAGTSAPQKEKAAHRRARSLFVSKLNARNDV